MILWACSGMVWHGISWNGMDGERQKWPLPALYSRPDSLYPGSYFASPQSTSLTALYLLFMAGKAVRQSVCDATLVQILQHTAMAACQVWFLDPAGQSG